MIARGGRCGGDNTKFKEDVKQAIFPLIPATDLLSEPLLR